MKILIEGIKIALRVVFANKLRSFLTMLGIVIGIVNITLLLTIALSVRREIESQVESLGSNLITVVPGNIRTSSGRINPTASIGSSTLTEQDYRSIQTELPAIKHLTMVMLLPDSIRAGDKTSSASRIFAATPEVTSVLNTQIEKGRSIQESDMESNARVIVLGANQAIQLFGDKNIINKTIQIRGETFTVVGLIKEKPNALSFAGPNLNDLVILPITTGWDMTGSKQVFRIMMQSPNSETVDENKEKIEQILLKNHGGEENFSVVTQDDILGTVRQILDILTFMLGTIAAISLIVGGIGIMNIMLVSVTERTKEIGIRKAVGATTRHILIQFLVEAVVLSLLGGIIGISIVLLTIIIANQYSPLPLTLPYLVILLAILFSVIVGVIFGVIPAYRAATKDPIQALRSE